MKELIKDAFDEGRLVGGEWEDSDAYVVNKMFPIFDLDNAII